ncbi:unnamed protein product [Cuscuta europaea]|uniref:Uncharacterized protein n=1 Tax=Cuscuta europaea TaxID=41803 RepID=A0A9P0Z4W9_CUSEU|nr:unnamed protein product [Cuscuta europaea]
MNCSNSSPLPSLSSNAMESAGPQRRDDHVFYRHFHHNFVLKGGVLEEVQGQLADYAADSLSIGMICYDIDVGTEFYKEFAP